MSDHIHPKISEITFSFRGFAPESKKIKLVHLSILEIKPILESCDKIDCTHFWISIPKNFLVIFNLYGLLSTCKKIRLFHWLVLEIWLIRKSCNLIGWEYLDPYLRNHSFPEYVICAGTQQKCKFSSTMSKFRKNW